MGTPHQVFVRPADPTIHNPAFDQRGRYACQELACRVYRDYRQSDIASAPRLAKKPLRAEHVITRRKCAFSKLCHPFSLNSVTLGEGD
jgi:hypothetical protein